MAENEECMVEIASLRKQIRLMAILLFGSWMVLIVSLVNTAHGHISSNSAWPDLSANKLQVRRIVLMNKYNKPVGVLGSEHGNAAFSLMDDRGDNRIFLLAGKDSGFINLIGKDSGKTFVENGLISMGNKKSGGVFIAGSESGGPVLKVYDSSGYSASLGSTALTDNTDGTVSVTSAASLTGSSNAHAYSWSLLSQPTFSTVKARK